MKAAAPDGAAAAGASSLAGVQKDAGDVDGIENGISAELGAAAAAAAAAVAAWPPARASYSPLDEAVEPEATAATATTNATNATTANTAANAKPQRQRGARRKRVSRVCGVATRWLAPVLVCIVAVALQYVAW
jgi:hypothetical protein